MIQKLLILMILLLIIPDIYIYRMFISRWMVSPYIKILYFIPTLALLGGIACLGIWGSSELMEQHSLSIGYFAVAFFVITFAKLIFMVCSLIGLPLNYWLHWPKAPFVYVGLTLATLNSAMLLYGALIGKERFDVKEVTFTSPQLPKGFDGYRIVQLSDLHIGSWKGNGKAIQRMVDLVNAQKPDLIVFTGDLVNNRASELNEFENILSQLHAKDGVYSILGNHDYGPYYRWKSPKDQVNNLIDLKNREARMGWKMLNNDHTILYCGNDSIALIGVENEGEPPFSQHGDLAKATQGTNGMFQLLLSHNPTHWRREVLSQSEVNLMLAGHTHAMQFALGHHSPSSMVYPEWGGMYKEGNRGLYVNIGLGFVGMPFRFGAWPEITVITLRQ